MGEFSDGARWRLVNGHTIYTDHELHDRPMMITSVPKRIDVEITEFEVVRYLDWPEPEDRTQHPGLHADRTYISFNGTLFDRVTVFDMAKGEVAAFRMIERGTIRIATPGTIGGRHFATSVDGIGYSGMSSRDVPDGGLMAGEPGNLVYLPSFEREPGDTLPDHLTASLHLDAEAMGRLVADLQARPKEVGIFKLHLLVELFETETSASLSEPWMRREYGLLSQGDYTARTSARIEAITLTTGVTRIGPADEVTSVPMPQTVAAPPSPVIDTGNIVGALRWILIALVALIVVTVLRF